MRNALHGNRYSQILPDGKRVWGTRGLIGLKPPPKLEIQPYTLAQLDTLWRRARKPYRDGTDMRLTGGLDAKIGVDQWFNGRLDHQSRFWPGWCWSRATVLDGFEIFFQERRPFLETKHLSITILREMTTTFSPEELNESPRKRPSIPRQCRICRPTDNTTILGAAKLSGKTKMVGHWVAESVTAKEYADVTETGGEESKHWKPLTNYFRSRVQKDFNDRNQFYRRYFTALRETCLITCNFAQPCLFGEGGWIFSTTGKTVSIMEGSAVLFSNGRGSAEAITNTQTPLPTCFQRADASHVEVDPTKNNN